MKIRSKHSFAVCTWLELCQVCIHLLFQSLTFMVLCVPTMLSHVNAKRRYLHTPAMFTLTFYKGEIVTSVVEIERLRTCTQNLCC